MPVLWQAAFFFLALCVLIEGVAIFALARVIGLLQIRLGPEPVALQTADGLALNAEAPAVGGFDMRLRRPVAFDVRQGQWGLVFVSATCGSCRDLVRDAARVDKDRAFGARIVVVSHGTEDQNALLAKQVPELLFLSDAHGDTHKVYAVESTPYAFLVEDGRVRAKGIVNHRDHLEALLEGKAAERPDLAWVPGGEAVHDDLTPLHARQHS